MANMGPVFCPRCQRANPSDAAFCHFDGVGLRSDGRPSHELGREFVFPGGGRCRTFDELVAPCSADWTAGRQLLKTGHLKQFLAGIGRADLAATADRAAARADLDLGLDQLLGQFPCQHESAPKLDLAPRRIQLGIVPAGTEREVTLSIFNHGQRLVHGTVEVRGGDWIQIAPASGPTGESPPSEAGSAANGKATIRANKVQHLQVRIATRGLPAGQRYAATLAFITSGGAAEVPISVEVAPVPFPDPPLHGAATPRELATAMREAPKAAAPLLTDGRIARWFADNGWRYPVVGPVAKGVAAVQQFFEALGLSKPPPLELQPATVALGVGDRPRRGSVELVTSTKKWVFARVDSDTPWLRPLEADVSGPVRATIEFEVLPNRLPEGREHAGSLLLVANGQERFVVPVRALARGAAGRRTGSLVQAATLGFVGGGLVRAAYMLAESLATYQPALDSAGWLALLAAPVGAGLGAWSMLQVDRQRGDLALGAVAGALLGLVAGITVASMVPGLDAVGMGLANLGADPARTSAHPVPWLIGVATSATVGLFIGVGWRLRGRLMRLFLSLVERKENRSAPPSPRTQPV